MPEGWWPKGASLRVSCGAIGFALSDEIVSDGRAGEFFAFYLDKLRRDLWRLQNLDQSA